MIAALPKIVSQHADVLYLVVGQTHPDVKRADGESYRNGLTRLVADLDLTDHVRFVNRFADIGEIARLLAQTAIYLTPYRSREQIVSGALTFAIAAGCPVVSTPYFYAEDLLGFGAGALVPFDDVDALSSAVVDLLDDPQRLTAATAAAHRVGAGLTWSQVAADTLAMLRQTRQSPHASPRSITSQSRRTLDSKPDPRSKLLPDRNRPSRFTAISPEQWQRAVNGP